MMVEVVLVVEGLKVHIEMDMEGNEEKQYRTG